MFVLFQNPKLNLLGILRGIASRKDRFVCVARGALAFVKNQALQPKLGQAKSHVGTPWTGFVLAQVPSNALGCAARCKHVRTPVRFEHALVYSARSGWSANNFRHPQEQHYEGEPGLRDYIVASRPAVLIAWSACACIIRNVSTTDTHDFRKITWRAARFFSLPSYQVNRPQELTEAGGANESLPRGNCNGSKSYGVEASRGSELEEL
jgi:hypothetical protein